MASAQGASYAFAESLGCLITPAMGGMAAQLALVTGLSDGECGLIARTLETTLLAVLHGKLSRLLLLELHAARKQGRLHGADSVARWTDFIALSSHYSFWEGLAAHYPDLLLRVTRIVNHRCASMLAFAKHFAADRGGLDTLNDKPLGELTSLHVGAGDSHRGGQTVTILQCTGGNVVYKPRSVAIDAELRRFVLDLPLASPCIRVPRVIDRGKHGWVEFIPHRYADNDAELADFYCGIGQWLAIMRLLGGSDLHSENLIAHGSWPIVVDCETLFLPGLKADPSPLGLAFDHVTSLTDGSVLSIGLLPGRGSGLAWRGVDPSGIGALPDQQPSLRLPEIVDAGTDQARLETVQMEAQRTQNHPAQNPSLARYWPKVLDGFTATSETLRGLDAADELAPRLQAFADCPIRVVTRATEVYAELMRMLWHPVSLHRPDKAERHAHELLAKMGANRSIAPDDDTVIWAEIAELRDGDVPFFATRPCEGRLAGPGGTFWLEPRNLIADSLRRWRNADLALERRMIQAALASAYADDGDAGDQTVPPPQHPPKDRLERRRRAQMAQIMDMLMSARIAGEDDSITWIASVRGATGLSVQPMAQGLYGGLNGIAVLAAVYLHETQAGRADPVPELKDMLRALIKTIRRVEEERLVQGRKVSRPRPPAPGGYVGLGSEIWAWLMLAQYGIVPPESVERACALAELIPAAAEADELNDLLTGKAGAIVPLLRLARVTGKPNYLDLAIQLGDQLCESARREDGKAYWVHPRWPRGMGGYAHGVTGIGWALAKLARASGIARFANASAEAFAFEDTLFLPEEQNWIDLRKLHRTPAIAAWCHGAVGIGLTIADLHPGLRDEAIRGNFQAAAHAAWRLGMGMGHGICHGDLGAWELLEKSIQLGLGPAGVGRDDLLATVLASLEQHGPVCGSADPTFSPGLMSGLGGIVYQLLRAHPDCHLPSVMIMSC